MPDLNFRKGVITDSGQGMNLKRFYLAVSRINRYNSRDRTMEDDAWAAYDRNGFQGVIVKVVHHEN
jgi:hypothetical protein